MRAGLSQRELADRVNRPSTQIARWERDEVEPPLSTLRWLMRACGFEAQVVMAPYAPDEKRDDALQASLRRTPSERVDRLAQRLDAGEGQS